MIKYPFLTNIKEYAVFFASIKKTLTWSIYSGCTCFGLVWIDGSMSEWMNEWMSGLCAGGSGDGGTPSALPCCWHSRQFVCMYLASHSVCVMQANDNRILCRRCRQYVHRRERSRQGYEKDKWRRKGWKEAIVQWKCAQLWWNEWRRRSREMQCKYSVNLMRPPELIGVPFMPVFHSLIVVVVGRHTHTLEKMEYICWQNYYANLSNLSFAKLRMRAAYTQKMRKESAKGEWRKSEFETFDVMREEKSLRFGGCMHAKLIAAVQKDSGTSESNDVHVCVWMALARAGGTNLLNFSFE